MTVCAISMMRDEADVAGQVVAHLLAEGVDHVIVADNLSTDETREILDAFPVSRVTVLDDDEPGYYQADKMTRLARRAYDAGATFVLPFDADEVWYAPGSTLGEFFAACRLDVIEARGWDHIAHGESPGSQPFRWMTYRRPEQQPLPKVAFRAHPYAELHMGNHDVNRPGKRGGGLEYRHFQYRTFEQMRRKVRQGAQAYAVTPLHEMYGTHWRDAAALDDETLRAEWGALCNTPGLTYDPAPLKP